MLRTRVIPVLLLKDSGLVKTIKFKNPKYVGDPINAVKIFNEKEVDELVFLDINASKNNEEPNFEIVKNIASEAFMPLGYGGGITNLSQIEKLFRIGIEKVIINTAVIDYPELITEASKTFGSQSVVVSLDIKKNFFGNYELYSHSNDKSIKLRYLELIQKVEDLGAGEIIINSVDRDGTKSGYDLELLKKATDKVNVPVVACGGAANLEQMKMAVNYAGVSAVAAGSMFVFYGKHRAVLITYPDYNTLKETFN